MAKIFSPAAAVLASALTLACWGAPAVPLLQELEATAAVEARPQWPPPPAEARVRYLGAIDGQRGFEPRAALWKRVVRAIHGRPGLHFVRPAGLCVSDQRLAVADPGAALVHMLDLYERRWQALGATLEGPLRSPVGVACLPDGRLVVSDSVLGALYAYAPDGTALGRFAPDPLERPTGLTYDTRRDWLWVTETRAHRIRAFDREGRERMRIGERGSGLGRFNYPTMLAGDPKGGVWLTDSLNFRLQHVDAAGRPDRVFGVAGDRPGTFARPRGLAVDAEERVFVVDALFDAVQIFDPEGRLLLVFGERGTGPGQLWLPADVALDGLGHVYVSDSYNQRVQVFSYHPPSGS